MLFKCENCGYRTSEVVLRCPNCNSVLEPEIKATWSPRGEGFWRYSSLLPPLSNRISLGEGGTPLISSRWFSKELGISVYFKDESRNPTGSLYDRVAALISSHILSENIARTVVASDGNLGASLSAYLAGMNIDLKVVVPRRVDPGKKAQMALYGAEIIVHGETLDEAVSYALKLSRRGYYNATAELNPLGYTALATIAYEVYEQLGRNPESIIVPTASGTTVYGLYKGFKTLLELGLIDEIPKIIIVQTPPCPTIASELGEPVLVTDTTPITGLTYCKPPLLREVVDIVKKTHGKAIVVSIREVYEAALELAGKEGLLVEPASAAAVAGLKRLAPMGGLSETIVLLTGSGLKVISSYFERARGRTLYSVPTKAEILRIIDEHGEMHGYAIWRLMEGKITPQSVYQHLRELEERGFVKAEYKERRKVYRLTEKGKRVLELFLQLIE